MTKKIIIVGNCIAGVSAAEEIIKNAANVEITIVSKENSLAYYRPMLSEYISDSHNEKRFLLHDKEWYSENKINLILGNSAVKIDKTDKILHLDNGETLSYNKLILANGSHNFIPPIPGHEKKGVFSLRCLSDADIIKEKAKSSKSAIVIGGGILGLEVGWQLRKLGLEITVFDIANRLLSVQLDKEASDIFEEKVLETGIKVIKNAKISSIIGDESASGIKMADETVFNSDFVVISAGVRANVDLAKTADIPFNRALIVNDKMETSEPDIYAAGDVAEFNGINYAIWPEAMEQGKVAGKNAIGMDSSYEQIVPSNIYMGMNLKLFSIGDVGNKDGTSYECIKKHEGDYFEKFYFVDDYFVGGILIGNISKSLKLKNALKSKLKKSEFLETL